MAERGASVVRVGAPPVLLGAILALTALNLRAAVTSVGPVLRELQLDLGISDTLAGVLTTLPLLSFGIIGLLAARIGRRLGTEPALVLAMFAIVAGLAIRAAAPTIGWLLVTTFIALAGIAVANVLVPVAVKAWFPDAVGRATGLYSMAISAGVALPAGITVPVADAFGSWRFGLAVWAIPALLALGPWAVLAVIRRRDARASAPVAGGPDVVTGAASASASGATTSTSTPVVPVHRRVKAWGLTVFFGLQSLEAYTAMGWLPAILQDAGLSPTRAGVMLAVTMAIGAPISLALPVLAARSPDQRPWVYALAGASVAAYVGLIVAPEAAPLLWAVLLGIGLGAFPLALVLLGLRASTAAGTGALSSLAQGGGYLMAALGPVTVGALHDVTGEWVWPLLALLVLLVPKVIAGSLAASPGYVDD